LPMYVLFPSFRNNFLVSQSADRDLAAGGILLLAVSEGGKDLRQNCKQIRGISIDR
jgi:hypothetical protein